VPFFVAAGSCSSVYSGVHCSETNLGERSFDNTLGFIQPSSLGWNPGRVIASEISVGQFYSGNLESLKEMEYSSTFWRKCLPKIAKVHIYCAPCANHVQTALHICDDSHIPSFLEFLVRIDDRLVSDGFGDEAVIDRLSSIAGKLKDIGAYPETYEPDHPARFVDLPWIEQRIFQLEDDIDQFPRDSADPSGAIAQIFQENRSHIKRAGVVILTEVDQCSVMMETHPFPPMARKPRQNEIFMMEKNGNDWKRRFLMRYVSKHHIEPRHWRSLNTGDAYASWANRLTSSTSAVRSGSRSRPAFSIPHPPLPDPSPLP
jgi:hypothetical protein